MRYNLIVAVIILIPLQLPMVDKLTVEAVAYLLKAAGIGHKQ